MSVKSSDKMSSKRDKKPKSDKKKRKHSDCDDTNETPKRHKSKKSDKHSSKSDSKSKSGTIEPTAAIHDAVKTTTKPSNPSVDDFAICAQTKKNLQKHGIAHLFPIQAMTFDKIIAGNNLIGRARTGMGKTLAFALPVVEKLLQSKKKPVPNRAPRVICVTPTRELARQVTTEFEKLDTTLTTVCIYGGTPYQQQNASFRSGTDIVIGTTGRIMDHIDRGNLRFANCEFLILDEADTMLEMGFRDDIQRIFDATQKSGSKPQILLFSATIPKWLHEIADRYMDKTYEFVNLVSDSDDQASLDVQHIAIPCHWQSRPTLLASLLSVYAKQNARTIIFAETKKDCNELSVHPEIKQDCQVLHGDIAQDQRETTMKAFRQGQIKLLIATDVAARGLDMNVDLVINSEPPRKASGNADVDTYVHRSGRTGRAGKKGICITLYTTRQKELLDLIERKIGNKFIMRHQPTVRVLLISFSKLQIQHSNCL